MSFWRDVLIAWGFVIASMGVAGFASAQSQGIAYMIIYLWSMALIVLAMKWAGMER